MKKLKNWIFIFISIAVLAVSVYLLQRLAPQFLQKFEPAAGLKNIPVAPDFTLNDLDGQKLKLSDLREKIVILNFWTSWNEASLEQTKILNDYYKSYSSNDLVILAVSSQEEIEPVKTAQKSQSLDIKILLDTNGEVGELYGIGALPITVFIDKAGLQNAKIIGPLTTKEIEDKIASLR